MTTFASVTVATLGWLALGAPVGWAFLRRGQWALALGVLPAAAGLSIVVPIQIAAWTAGDLGGWVGGSVLTSIGLGVGCELFLRGSPAALTSHATLAAPDARWVAAATVVLAAFGVWHIHVGLVLSEGPPSFTWDGYQIWLLRAKVLAQSESLPVAFWSEPQIARSQWNYPMWLPAYLAWFLRFTPLQLYELQLPLGVLAALAPISACGLLARCIPLPAACAVALVPFAVPKLLWLHFMALADPLLVMFVVPGGAAAFAASRTGDRPLAVAAGVTLAAATAVKNDATLWLASIFLGIALSLVQRRELSWRAAGDVLRMALPAIAVFGLWSRTTRRLGLTNELPLGPDPLERLSAVAYAMVLRLTVPGTAAVILLCIAALLVFLPGRPTSRLLATSIVLAVPAAYIAGISLIYLTIYLPPPLDIWWMILTSQERLMLGVVPMLVGLTVVAATMASPSLPPGSGPERCVERAERSEDRDAGS